MNSNSWLTIQRPGMDKSKEIALQSTTPRDVTRGVDVNEAGSTTYNIGAIGNHSQTGEVIWGKYDSHGMVVNYSEGVAFSGIYIDGKLAQKDVKISKYVNITRGIDGLMANGELLIPCSRNQSITARGVTYKGMNKMTFY
jgi:hypothetical protein